MKEAQRNRLLQKFILAVSLMVVVVGIYLIITNGFSNFIRLGMQTREPPTTKRQPFAILFVVALVMAVFSGRNLLKRK